MASKPTILTDPADQAFAQNAPYAKPADSYQTKLNPQDEVAFWDWIKSNKVPFEDGPKSDYDMRGFWQAAKNGDQRASTAVNPNDGQMHFSDYWKTPYHESFSDESQWAAKGAPHWNDKDQLVTPDGKVVFDERANAQKKRK